MWFERFFRNVKMRTIERAAATSGLVLGGIIWYTLETSSWASKSVMNSPSFFPEIVAVSLIIVSVVIFAYSFATSSEKTVRVNFLGFLICILGFVYALICEHLGFILSSMLLIGTMMLLWGTKNKRTVVLVSVISPLVIYAVFGFVLHVRFPMLFLS